MKNKLISKTLAIAALALTFLMLPSFSKAQANCPYTIQNNLSCPVDFKYSIYRPNNCAVVCASGSGTLPPGGNIVIPCSDFCGPFACNLRVEVFQVGGTPPTPNPIVVHRFMPAAAGTSGSAACPNINMNWTPTQTDINP
jgi:hypothetical protein